MARSVADLDRIVDVLLAQVQAESTQSITDVQFETGVEHADAVFLDTNYNTWRRSIVDAVNAPERAIFHGVANITEAGNSVRIYGFQSSDDFLIYNDETDEIMELFTPGDFVYVSTKALGAYTQTPNEIQAGVAVGADRFLLASELDNVTTALRTILNNAKDQSLVEVTEAQRADGYSWPSLQARLDGNYSRIEETDENIAALVLELAQSYGAYTSLDSRFAAVESISDANTAELATSAGTAQTLSARLAVGMNEDGSLKSAISASTYTTETETLTRVGANAFSVPTDKTGVYLARRTVRINDSITAHVNFSAFTDSTTVVTLVESLIPVSLTKIEYSFSPAEMPIMRHTDLTEVRTVDPTSDDTVRTKHVSNHDLKTLYSVTTAQSQTIVENTNNIFSNTEAIGTAQTDIDAVEAQIAALGDASTYNVGTGSTDLTTNATATDIANARATAQIAALGLGTASTYAVGTGSTNLTTNSRVVDIANSPTYLKQDLSAPDNTTTTFNAPSGYRYLTHSYNSDVQHTLTLTSVASDGSSISLYYNGVAAYANFDCVWIKNSI